MAIPTLRSIFVRIRLLTALLCAGATPQNAFAQGATVEATPSGTALSGSTVTVKWSGPNGRGDYITIVRKGAGPFEYLDYRQTSDGRAPVNPVSLVVPAQPGAYEIRYVGNNPRAVLASVPYEVTAIAASIEGPASVTPDSRFEVAWSGPNNRGDFVTIVAAGAAPRAYGPYVDARIGRADDKTGRTVATLRAPAQPGRYELRYVQQGTHVIGARAIDVGASSAAAAPGAAGGAASAAAGASPAGAGPASASSAGIRTDAGAAAGAASGSSAAAGAGASSAAGAGALAGTRAGAGVAASSAGGGAASTSAGSSAAGAAPAGAGNAGASASAPQMTVIPLNPSVLGVATAQQTPASGSQPAATATTGSGTASSGQPVARSGSTATPAGLSAIAGTTPTGGGLAGTADLTMKTCTTAAAPQFSATPGGVTFTLTKPAGTTGYRISRRDVGELTPSPITAASYTHAGPLDYRQTYQYVVTGVLSSGGCTTASVSVTPPKPLTPQVTAKAAPGQVTGRVTLSWAAQNDRPTSYLVLGPGLTEAGTEVPASTSPAGHTYEIGNLAVGTHSWLVTPVWKSPAGTMSDASLGARVTATVTSQSARYRVLLTGFRVNHETNAGTFGEHNAVYAAASVEVLNRQNNFAVVQQPFMVRSRVHGDTNRDPTRVRAGSSSPTGGLLAGDAVPAADPAAAGGTLPPSTTSFPLLVWEGSLTYGMEAVIIRPTLWVWNGGQQAFQEWSGLAMNQVGIGGGQLLRARQLSTVTSVIARSELSFRSSTLITCFMDPGNITGSACAEGRDRPIGVTSADHIPEYNGWRRPCLRRHARDD